MLCKICKDACLRIPSRLCRGLYFFLQRFCMRMSRRGNSTKSEENGIFDHDLFIFTFFPGFLYYRNDPKFSDR